MNGNPYLHRIYELFGNPGRLILGLWEYFLSWLFSRQWLGMLAFCFPLVGLLCVLTTAAIGRYRSPELLLERYWGLVDADTRQFDSSSNSPTMPEQDQAISDFSQALLQRIMALDTSNLRATYLVARQLGAKGRYGQARWMMRSIAGEKAKGFPPAHAWLAQDRLTRVGLHSPADQRLLIHDLEVAATWPNVSPLLNSILADVLVGERRVGEALQILEQTAAREPALWIKLARVALDQQRTQAYEDAAAQVRQRLLPKLEAQEASAEEMAQLAQLLLFEEKLDEAIQLANRACRQDASSEIARRTLSEALRMKFTKTADPDQRKFDLDLLDAAIKADGTNPKVTEEIAKLIAMGQKANLELTQALEDKLAKGEATTLTHILLANRHLLDGKMTEAIGHLEIALRLAPNSPVILNNLALAKVRQSPGDPKTLQIAEAMLTRGLQISGPNAELYDSLGEIRATAGNHVGAVESLEAAIGVDGNRPSTRRKLAVEYRAVGLHDMAAIQEQLADQKE